MENHLLQQLNDAVEYIERNITDNNMLAKAHTVTRYASYHFARIFGYLADIPLAEYIRRRRMTLAAQTLQGGAAKVLDTAIQYGYDSTDSFSRAFYKQHGILPSQARKPGAVFVSYPKLSFQISIKGAMEMNYRMEEKNAFRIIGARYDAPADLDENFEAVPAIWAAARADGTIERLLAYTGRKDSDLVGFTTNIGAETFHYHIAVITEQDAGEFAELAVPAATWAVFTAVGTMPTASQDMWLRILGEWLPSSAYDLTDLPEYEAYNDNGCEIFIPVKKK